MGTRKKVSIIVPVYNREKLIGRCLKSICNQTYTNIEIIVVDDGSTDESYSVCNKLASIDKRIVLITKSNSGVSATRNVGLKAASGDYLTFVDSDDYVDIKYVEVLVGLCVENNCQLAFCGYSQEYVDYHRSICFPISSKHKILDVSNRFPDKRFFPRFACTGLFERAIVSDYRFIEGLSYGEDKLFSMNAIFNSKRVAYTNEILYHVWLEPDSLSRSAFSDYKASLINYLEPEISLKRTDKRKYYCIASLFCDYLKGTIVEYSDNKFFLENYYKQFLKKYRHYFAFYWPHFNQCTADTLYEMVVFAFPRLSRRIKNLILKKSNDQRDLNSQN